MSELLTAEGYEQTKEKLRDLETRLAEIEKRTDLAPAHLASVKRSYKTMIREFLQEIKLYEARQAKASPMAPV
jgi:flagellar biosynthesis/type III secretory pathway protein FliH